MAIIREAKECDVEQVRDLFAHVYGADYPFQGFYNTNWLKKAIFADDTLFLVAEHEGKIVATGSIMRSVGDLDDLLGELGRLVAETSKCARGAAKELIAELLRRVEDKVHFAYGEIRTVHAGAQKLARAFEWAVVGFEPLKYQFTRRESVVFYARLHHYAIELRRNNPRVIPEVSLIAQVALKNTKLPVDVIVEDEADGYPIVAHCNLHRLREEGVTPLLRIERGRTSNREVFGNFSLAHGFFNIVNSNSHYLVAKDDDAILGAVGFTYDEVDSKVRIFEMIEFDDAVKGCLLAEVDRIAREEFKAAYQEVDVSAYSPKIQRTLERLGFIPVAYCPAMVFENVERLDIVRMAKLNAPYDLGPLKLLPDGARMREIVELGLEDRLLGMKITEATRQAEIFHNLPDGDLFHLTRISQMREYTGGKQLIREGEMADILYILADGEAEVRAKDGSVLATLGSGQIFGEMGLIEQTVRSSDVFLTKPSQVIEIQITRLERLMHSHPRLGFLVISNIASSLSQKLRGGRENCLQRIADKEDES